MTLSRKALDDLALSNAEYEEIVKRLGREPNKLELGLFGSLWSEHCGYKHSRGLLKMLDTNSPRLLATPGSENAGVIDAGDGLAIVMKIESHNHPSAIEPYQGAATGVGGIVRDIFTMGARPIALLNSLRFGDLADPRNRYLFEGVISGISGYGNCIGIPNVGGEIVCADTYSDNPLVNVMCVGLLAKDRIVSATTGQVGNLLMLVGADTGRDGIHGASGLASRAFEETRELRPAVQVGNPFLEKVLIEACLEIVRTGYVSGLQDLGAAGLTSASVEAASKSGHGIEIDVSRVPRRESNMTPYEIMLSESQERMLVIVKSDQADDVTRIFDERDLHSNVIGTVTDDGLARIRDGDKICAEIPVKLLTDPPSYRVKTKKPEWLRELQQYDLDRIPLPKSSPKEVLLRLLKSTNIASKSCVYHRYDHQVQTNTVISPGGDAALIRIKGTNKGVALATDGNGRYCYLSPYMGGAIAVAEACRNLSCVGAEPVALTDCLNFGNPERSEVYYQLEECIKGISEASNILGTPVVSGNVSLYNETRGEAIYPTPVIGSLGLLEDISVHATSGFKDEGDIVVLIGDNNLSADPLSLSGSEYLEIQHGLVVGSPSIDLDLELAVQRSCRLAIREKIIKSAHDCSDGGLGVALAECCIIGGVGFTGEFQLMDRWDALLFGENQSRIIVSLKNENLPHLQQICRESGSRCIVLGEVSGDSLKIKGLIEVGVPEISAVWNKGLERVIADS